MSIKEKTIRLIDELKATCAHYGLGNDGNEYKIITQVFLYKFLNDKFGYAIKNAKSDIAKKIAAAPKWDEVLTCLFLNQNTSFLTFGINKDEVISIRSLTTL